MDRPPVIPEQRRGLALDFLLKRGTASIQELCVALGTSASTIRRDLERLEEEGHIRRTHGGAVLRSAAYTTFEPSAAIAAQVSRAEKSVIGRAAAHLVSAGDSVILDSGSTVMAAAKVLVERRIALTTVTNDLGIGEVLASSENISVVVMGGTIRRGSLTLVGEPAQGFIKNIHADVAFIGTHSISDRILTETSIEIASMKRAMIAAAARVVLLADSTKFRSPAFYKICDILAVHEVITDGGAAPHLLTELRDAGLKVTVVEVTGNEQ